MTDEVNLSKSSIDALAEKLGGGNSAARESSGGGLSGLKLDADSFNRVLATASPLAVAFGDLTKGASGATTVLNGLASGVKAVGLEGFGNALGTYGKALLDNKAQLDAAGKIGLGGNDIGAFNRQAKDAGLSTQEFTQTIQESKGSIGGLTGSAYRTGDVFSKLAADVRTSDTGRNFQALGGTTKELADITALSVMNARKLDLSRQEDQLKAKIAAQELAQQITETSLATGVSRDAIIAGTKAELEKPKTAMAMAQMSEEQRKAFEKTQASLVTLGPSVQNLATEIMTGGARTKDAKDTLAALGAPGIELQQALLRQKNASTEVEKAEAARAVEKAKADINGLMAQKSYNDQAQTGTSAVAQQMVKLYGENQSLNSAAAAAKENQNNFEKGQQAQQDESRARMAGQKVDKEGKPVVDEKGKAVAEEGQQATRLVNELNARTKDQAAGLMNNIEKANNAFFKTPEAVANANKALDTLVGPRQNVKEATENQASKMNDVKDLLKDTVNSVTGGKTSVPAPQVQRDASGNIAPPGRDGGTLEKTGSPVEPNDAIVKIHKGETVLTPDATKNMGKVVSDASKTGSQTIDSTLSPAKSPNAPGEGTAKEKTSVTEADSAEYMAQWKKNYNEQSVVMIGAEKRDTEESIQRNQERIAQKSAKIKELEDIKATRELTDSEQSELRIAERRKARAEQNLASDQARITVLQDIEKNGLGNQAAMVAKWQEGQAQAKKAQDETAAATTKAHEEAKVKAIENVKETVTINGKVVDPNSPEAQAVKNNVAEAKTRMSEMLKNMDPKSITEMALMGKGDSAKQAKEFLMNQVKETMPDPTKLAEKMPSAADLKAQYAKMSTDLNATPEGLTKLKSQLDAQTAKEAEAAKPKAGQVGYIAEKKKDMENMFGKIGGDMFNPVIKDPKQAEINKAKFAEEDKKKAEEDKKKEEPKKEEKPKTAEHEVTIKDLNDQLIKLNSNITKLVSHGEVTADATTKAAKNTKQGRF